MLELISEPLAPITGSFDTRAMGRGEPGLPAGFIWRRKTYHIADRLEAWKLSSREGGGAGDLYLRRHYYRLRMSDGSIWIVYFVRQTPRSGSAKHRWFLYTKEDPADPRDAGPAWRQAQSKHTPSGPR